jgi:hypothetical protein
MQSERAGLAGAPVDRTFGQRYAGGSIVDLLSPASEASVAADRVERWTIQPN